MRRLLLVMLVLWAVPGLAQSSIVASYPSESFGGALADMANTDPLTVMFCADDAPDGTSTLNCGTNAVKDASGWRNGHGVAAQTWSMAGTVPRATQSALYPNGFESRHAGLNGWTNSSKWLSLGTGNDVLDFAGDFTLCMIVNANTVPAYTIPFSDGTLAVGGYLIQLTPAVRLYESSSGANKNVDNGSVSVGTNVLCVGRSGSTLWAAMNNYTPTSTAGTTIVPATSVAASIGTYSGGSNAFDGQIQELFATTTTPTSGNLTALLNAALACTHPGPCVPDDANVVMHCYVPSG